MIVRIVVCTAVLALAACAGPTRPTGVAGAVGYTPPLAEGMARLRLARSDEVTLLPQKAQLRVDGRLVAELGASEQHVLDLPAGRHVVAVSQRAAAASDVLPLDAAAGRAYRILVVLDPARFPPYDGPLRPLQFVRESLDAPNDDRRPMFRLRRIGEPERPPVRGSARRSQAELERELDRLDTGR